MDALFQVTELKMLEDVPPLDLCWDLLCGTKLYQVCGDIIVL